MVQVLVKPTLAGVGSAGHEQQQQLQPQQGDGLSSLDAGIMSREQHAQRMRDLSVKRAVMRAPRRGWSLSEYQGQTPTDHYQHQPHHHQARIISQMARQASIPENAILQSTISRPASPACSVVSSFSSSSSSSSGSTLGPMVHLPRHPKIPPPRRSHSVTDKEPEPSHPQYRHPGRYAPTVHLLDLPSELHYSLFDFLDPIDGACLGLAHPNLYAIHRRKNGTVPLCSRYSGPNDLEWAWRGAGSLLRRRECESASSSSNSAVADSRGNDTGGVREATKALERLRVKGQVYCRKCGISRCELHRHLRDWMGSQYEYCEIRKVFGPRAHEAARAHCYMSSPKNPQRCGRHGGSVSASRKTQ
ncbi:hypothetical protein E4U43_004657 [Claviceps pusilla]|uniref:F-box domain-containing protein n=1 Tax=Claviceps pusilla TaxID=123648 RepID=A0A9P7SVZ8_9HYPO|nr:hypothetical protein E4U43_004657 [Claviceps pusilla]